MKTKLFILLFAIALCSSCIDNKPKKIEFTDSNYIYEGELYMQYLTVTVAEVAQEIEVLQDSINNNLGDDNTEAALNIAQEQQQFLSNQIASIQDLVSIGVVPPRPPCPDADLCLPAELMYILTDRSLNEFSVEIFDTQGNSLFTTNTATAKALENSQELLNYNIVTPMDYVGEVTINVVRIDNLDNQIGYSVTAFQQ